MLQIIIWLGSFYLLIKGLDLLHSALTSAEGSKARTVAYVGFIGSVLGAIFFVYLANQQASGPEGLPGLDPISAPFATDDALMGLSNDVTAIDPIVTPTDVEAIDGTAEQAADAALQNAEAALKEAKQ